ncbi:MAG: RMD1 family protein [Chlamydiales bacterium]|nr:RMD1 family protein [Chlamydiales bacterium]
MSNIFLSDEDDSIPKRSVAYCTASGFTIRRLQDALKARYTTNLFRDVVHFELGSSSGHSDDPKDVFCFPYGVVVMWGLNVEEEQEVLIQLKEFQTNTQEIYECELMSFIFGSNACIEEEVIELPDTDVLSRLAVSHGLAQSVRLATFETLIQKTIDKTKHIPEQLAARGKIPLSKKEIRKKMGELFLERSSVNLHFDILDTPEFFWDHSDLEPLYIMIANHLDLETRVEVLNQRLDIVHDLFEMLGNELNHQHSSKLEWIIIWLIVIEVILSIAHFA